MVRVLTNNSTQTRQEEDDKLTNSPVEEEKGRQFSSDEVPKTWQCGEPYQYPLPTPEGNPWQILLTPMLEKDKAQCDAWKDEVQNLLIFASLFSAVVTTFVIETYKGLQQDPSNTMILLLSQIANNLENPRNNSSESTSTSLPSFSPTPSIVRVNIFLFVSLILSLTTVLIGIVSLQWLREHQAYTGSFTLQNTFAAVHMRSEALEKWRVPEIFAALPLLLQLALILFFIGIIDFLRDIDVRVVIPVASIIGLTLVFFLFTTMLPTLQAFILHHPNLKINDKIPVPCPYKSPQSRAFRRLITSSKLVFVTTSCAFVPIYWIFMRLCLLPGQILCSPFYQSVRQSLIKIIHRMATIDLWSSDHSPSFFLSRLKNLHSWDGFNYMTQHIYGFWSVKSSFDFDLVWLSIRDNYFQSTCISDSWLYQSRFDRQSQGALYDAVLGLCKELIKEDVNVNADFEFPIFTVYHCALDLSSINQLHGDEKINAARTRNAYLTTLLGYNQLAPFSFFPNLIHKLPLPLFSEEIAFVLLNFAHTKLYDSDISSLRISQHLAEISFRLLGYLFSHPHLTYMSNDLEDGPPEVLFSADELYVMKIFDDRDQLFTTQWALTIDLYFRAFSSPIAIDLDFRSFKSSFHGHPFIREYIWNFWKEVDSEFTNQNIRSGTVEQILHTFNLIDDTLKNLLENQNEHILHCIFYPAALYVQSCRRLLPDHDAFNEIIDTLIPALTRCKLIISSKGSNYQLWISSDEYDEDQTMALFSERWWNVLLSPDRVSYLSPSTSSEQQIEGNDRSRESPTVLHRSGSQLNNPMDQSQTHTTHPLDHQADPSSLLNARIDDMAIRMVL